MTMSSIRPVLILFQLQRSRTNEQKFENVIWCIKQIERTLGHKTLKIEILRIAVDFAKAKNWIKASPALPKGVVGGYVPNSELIA